MLPIGRRTKKGQDRATRLPVMKEEVPATVKLYLIGAIEQWYIKPDISGVVFVMNVQSTDTAQALLGRPGSAR